MSNFTVQLIATIVKILVMVGFLVNAGGLLTWYDRRGGAMMQDRIGPNRAGIKLPIIGELRIAGLLHAAADGVKFFTKKDFMPANADKLLFSLAPMLSLFPVLALTAVIPFGDTIQPESIVRTVCKHGTQYAALAANGTCPADYVKETVWPAVSRAGLGNSATAIPLTVAPLNVGILYVFAIAGQGIIGAAIAGWASDNKFSLMGALRAASQMVSYEVTLGLSLVGAFMIYGSVRLEDMVLWQDQNCWGIFVQPVAFFLFFACAIAESKRRMSFVLDRSPGSDHKLRFYESTKEEVLTTSWGRTDGYIHRDTDRPNDPRQSYQLVPGEFISPEELKIIRDFWT